MTIGGLGIFPTRGAPRALWAGVPLGSTRRVALQSQVSTVFRQRPTSFGERRASVHAALDAGALAQRPREPAMDAQAVHTPVGGRAGRRCHAFRKPLVAWRSDLYCPCATSTHMPESVIIAYFVGSIPFALLLARRWGESDLRLVGSGNLGAANVLRASGLTPGILVALLDVSKGMASVLIAERLTTAGQSQRSRDWRPSWVTYIRSGSASGVAKALRPHAASSSCCRRWPRSLHWECSW